MTTPVKLLEQLKSKEVIIPLDYHLAIFFTEQLGFTDQLQCNRFAFLVAWMSIEVRAGHVCINLENITIKNIDSRFGTELTHEVFSLLQNPILTDWLHLCDQVGAEIISHGEVLSPFILNGNNLYFQRMWLYEKQVADYFSSSNDTYDVDVTLIQQLVDSLFIDQRDEQCDKEIDWQKVAVISALTRKITIISGGPGTGKTTTVSKILAALVSLHQAQCLTEHPTTLRIIAAAPTGKAAARLTESLTSAIATLNVSAKIKASLPVEAVTLHRLLGANTSNNQYRYHKTNPLSADILLIDEVSMVDLPMMAHVIDALPDHCHLILLGDKEQLSSVEAGAVFGDLCELMNLGYSQQYVKMINDITGYQLIAKNAQPSIADGICLLQKSYRFNQQSGIGVLASLIKEGLHTDALLLLHEKSFQDIRFCELTNRETYLQAINESVEGYLPYLSAIKNHFIDVQYILTCFTQFRLLCALREGAFGVQGLNKIIEHTLSQKGLIRQNKYNAWYIGRPVMILRNSFSLGLYNGDIGIALPSADEQDQLRVYFLLPSGEIKGFSPSRLPEHETAYAMTIHKSQGSEFGRVNIILPNDYTSILTRSLLYTAITRAKQHVSIYSNDKILDRMIRSKTYRQSGLLDQIAHYQ